MPMRRFTRLTSAFPKKAENLAAAIALHYMHYNFCQISPIPPRHPRDEIGHFRPRFELG
jgi:hypothetical protein